MGIWNKLFGGADGCREAMRDSYTKHVRLAKEGRSPVDGSPHVTGLYGTLGTRYLARGSKVVEVVMWGELAPFLAMDERDAVEALAEYVVFQESPKDARITWLKGIINSALKGSPDDSYRGVSIIFEYRAMAAMGVINQVAWCDLLTPDTMQVLERVIDRLRQE